MLSTGGFTIISVLCFLTRAQQHHNGQFHEEIGTEMPSEQESFGPLPVRPQIVLNLTEGVFNLKNVKSGKYLNVQGGSLENGANIQLWNNPGSPHSQWRIYHVFEYGLLHLPMPRDPGRPQLGEVGVPGVYHVENVYSGKSLSVANGSVEDEANVEQRSDTALPSQWMIQLVGENIYGLQNANSAKWLNVEAGGVADGSNIWQFHSNLQNDSWWVLEKPSCKTEGDYCNWPANDCCMEGGGSFKQMKCELGHDVPASCYDTSKCTTRICDYLSCCPGWECRSGTVNFCQKKSNGYPISV
mmetsp:Transcript_21962/g.46694  ORF Transcript_21962/g.46694 Transcript_21962/m.46694 type:complete len:299 (+) Transcript_21962:16-912(+)